MVRKLNKTRLNEMRLEISDATPHIVHEPSRTKRRRKVLIGYARTSTSDQTAGLDAQQRDLTAAGCERVFREQVSSVSARAKLAECLSFLRHGDVLIVTKPTDPPAARRNCCPSKPTSQSVASALWF